MRHHVISGVLVRIRVHVNLDQVKVRYKLVIVQVKFSVWLRMYKMKW